MLVNISGYTDPVEEGSQLILTCSTDQQNAQFIWTFTTEYGQPTIYPPGNAAFSIDSVTSSDSGLYTCLVFTDYEAGSSEVNVVVKPSSQPITTKSHTTTTTTITTTTASTSFSSTRPSPSLTPQSNDETSTESTSSRQGTKVCRNYNLIKSN